MTYKWMWYCTVSLYVHYRSNTTPLSPSHAGIQVLREWTEEGAAGEPAHWEDDAPKGPNHRATVKESTGSGLTCDVDLIDGSWPCFLFRGFLNMLRCQTCAGGTSGLGAGEESWSKPCDCTCGHGRLLRCCGDERLSWAEGQAHGCWIHEHAGGLKYPSKGYA